MPELPILLIPPVPARHQSSMNSFDPYRERQCVDGSAAGPGALLAKRCGKRGTVGVRMTANYIPGALWLLRWQTHTLRILLGLFDYGFLLRRGALGELSQTNRQIPHLQRDNSFPRERFVPLFHLTD